MRQPAEREDQTAMNLRNSNCLNLTQRGVFARECSIVNDIIRSTSLDVARFRQLDLIREAEQARLIAEAAARQPSIFFRFVRLPIGRLVVTAGRRIQGRSIAAPETEALGASAALKLAR